MHTIISIPSSTFRRAALRIADPERWCQFDLAQDAMKDSVYPLAATAVRWCGMGAIMAELADKSADVPDLPFAVSCVLGSLDPVSAARGDGLTAINDQDGHEAVLCYLYELADRADGYPYRDRVSPQQFHDAAELLDHPDRWCEFDLALDANGQPCGPRSPDAIRWSAAGALMRVLPEDSFVDDKLMSYLQSENDFDSAIEDLRDMERLAAG